MTHFLTALRSGHWPTLLGAWLHLTVSFMVWLLIGALGVLIADTFSLTATEKVTAVAIPLLSGAFLRVVAGWSCDWFGAKRTGVAVLICELIAVLWGWLGIHSYADLMVVGLIFRNRWRQLRGSSAARRSRLSLGASRIGVGSRRVRQCRDGIYYVLCASMGSHDGLAKRLRADGGPHSHHLSAVSDAGARRSRLRP